MVKVKGTYFMIVFVVIFVMICVILGGLVDVIGNVVESKAEEDVKYVVSRFIHGVGSKDKRWLGSLLQGQAKIDIKEKRLGKIKRVEVNDLNVELNGLGYCVVRASIKYNLKNKGVGIYRFHLVRSEKGWRIFDIEEIDILEVGSRLKKRDIGSEYKVRSFLRGVHDGGVDTDELNLNVSEECIKIIKLLKDLKGYDIGTVYNSREVSFISVRCNTCVGDIDLLFKVLKIPEHTISRVKIVDICKSSK